MAAFVGADAADAVFCLKFGYRLCDCTAGNAKMVGHLLCRNASIRLDEFDAFL